MCKHFSIMSSSITLALSVTLSLVLALSLALGATCGIFHNLIFSHFTASEKLKYFCLSGPPKFDPGHLVVCHWVNNFQNLMTSLYDLLNTSVPASFQSQVHFDARN